MNVLVCEVEDIMMTAIRFRLEKNGFNMVPAANGEEAIAKIENGEVDLAIVGTHSENISASDVLHHVRKVLNSDLPIIVVANLEEGNTIIELLDAGANDFSLRPFKPMELIIRLTQVLKGQKTT